MPKMSKDSVAAQDHGPVVEWAEQLDGYGANIVCLKADMDMGPMLRGLPDDRCQCPHWGYVLNGSVTFRYADHDETYSAGDAFYAPPGHVPVSNEPGTEYVQFSPAAELAATTATIMENLAAMQPG